MAKGILKKIRLKLKNEQGSMFLMALVVIVLILGLGGVFLLASTVELQTAERQRLSVVAFNIAEAGIERALYDLRQDFVADATSPSWADGTINIYNIGPNTAGFYNIPYASTALNGGSYTASLMNAAGGNDIWLQSVGTINDVSHTLLVYVRMIDISPWAYAIFAGSGATGMMINGNVDIRGSVLALGDNLNPGDLAMDLGGTAQLVGNNYSGLAAALKALVPALPTTTFNGETVDTLNGVLRVKKGVVGLSGTATLGEPNVNGNSVKETIDGAYVTEGYSGNQGANNVYSDNGKTTGYDLGDAVEFPSLSDPAPEDTSKTFQQYFHDNALVLTNQLAAVTPTSTFSYSNAYGSISMNAGTITISGRVYVDGNNSVAFNKAGAAKTINYNGTGSLLVTGNVNINTNLLTVGNNSFPTSIMGIMTPGTITMNEAGIDVMGLFYAEDTIAVMKQTDILGTIVSNYFDLGVNVPSIFQVPETINNLPPGMIGSSSTWFTVVSWQKM